MRGTSAVAVRIAHGKKSNDGKVEGKGCHGMNPWKGDGRSAVLLSGLATGRCREGMPTVMEFWKEMNCSLAVRTGPDPEARRNWNWRRQPGAGPWHESKHLSNGETREALGNRMKRG